jgi:peptidoglycan/LPS O-acetylase OafA/YrhL
MGGLFLWGQWRPDVAPHTLGALVTFSFFSGNWYIFRYGWIADPFDPLWSISVEEQFYLTIPWIARYSKKKILVTIGISLILFSFAWDVYYAQLVYKGESGQWLNSFFQFQYFGAGMVLSLLLKGNMPHWDWPFRIFLIAVALVMGYVAVHFMGIRSWDGHPTILKALIGWGLVLMATMTLLVSMLGMIREWLPKWLVYLGKISYGLYLYHCILFFLVFQLFSKELDELFFLPSTYKTLWLVIKAVISLGLTIGIASLSYTYLERPFLIWKKRFTQVPSRPE